MDKPTRAEEYKALGNTFFSQHDIPNALKCYSKAIVFFTQRLNPSQSTYFSNRARAYFEAHRWKEAVGDCEEAIFISLENLKAVILLARAKACMAKELRSAKVTEEAIDDIKLAVYLARQQGNNELAGYAKVVRQKLKVLLDYQRRLEADTERQELKQYYEGVLGDTDDRLLKVSLYSRWERSAKVTTHQKSIWSVPSLWTCSVTRSLPVLDTRMRKKYWRSRLKCMAQWTQSRGSAYSASA